jgi:hypothetical protein
VVEREEDDRFSKIHNGIRRQVDDARQFFGRESLDALIVSTASQVSDIISCWLCG